ncbi:hypothetical protein ONE63_000089 [Megalurothrips usitatus]|uniref:Uncharacterized protein n=1 Tax=Megalurothrips usitatus TaxID=439358 RepID=A0AAV7Y0E4_9NEOP|nr:hypothetical protein ONE63_000089 [Megalurothrips usitatus]
MSNFKVARVIRPSKACLPKIHDEFGAPPALLQPLDDIVETERQEASRVAAEVWAVAPPKVAHKTAVAALPEEQAAAKPKATTRLHQRVAAPAAEVVGATPAVPPARISVKDRLGPKPKPTFAQVVSRAAAPTTSPAATATDTITQAVRKRTVPRIIAPKRKAPLFKRSTAAAAEVQKRKH